MTQNYKIIGEWIVTKMGQKYIAKAVNDNGRILAVATIDVPIDVDYDFVTYYGVKELKSLVENDAKAQVERLAKASP